MSNMTHLQGEKEDLAGSHCQLFLLPAENPVDYL